MKTTCFVPRSPIVSALMLILALASPPAALAADTPLKIAIIPFYTPEKIFTLYSPFVDYLNRTTQFKWELVIGDTHSVLVDKLARSEISIGMFGPIPFAQSRRKAPVRPLLITLTPAGETHYHSILVTADQSIGSVADLKGRTIAIFTGSTASQYLPMAMLAEDGIVVSPASLFQCTSQDRLVAALLNGEAAAGGIKEALYRKLNDPRLKVLKTSRPLPQFVFAASPDLAKEAAESFATVLLGLKPLVSQADREVVKGWDVEVANGFALPGDDFTSETEDLLKAVEPFVR